MSEAGTRRPLGVAVLSIAEQQRTAPREFHGRRPELFRQRAVGHHDEAFPAALQPEQRNPVGVYALHDRHADSGQVEVVRQVVEADFGGEQFRPHWPQRRRHEASDLCLHVQAVPGFAVNVQFRAPAHGVRTQRKPQQVVGVGMGQEQGQGRRVAKLAGQVHQAASGVQNDRVPAEARHNAGRRAPVDGVRPAPDAHGAACSQNIYRVICWHKYHPARL